MADNIALDNSFVERQNLKYNTVVNTFNDFTEIIYFKNEKFLTTGNCDFDFNTGEVIPINLERDTSRKFELKNGVLVPLKDSYRIEQLEHTLKSSRKRALDNLFGYALCNEWSYFVTLTFSPLYVNREDDEDIKYHWSKFRQKLQYYFNDIKILGIPERHPTSGNLHFHCLVGNCVLDKFLTRAINPHTGKQIYSNGRVVYNLNLFDFGFSTLVKIDSNPLKVVNYLSKYIVKDFGNIGYNKKNIFRTHNLNFKNKEYFLLNRKNLKDFKELYVDFLETYKETNDFIIYRCVLPFKE